MVLTEGSCQCADCCDMTYIGAAYIADMERGLTMTPEGELVAMGEFGLHYVDTLTGLTYFFFGIPLQPNWPWTHGCATGDGITYYTISFPNPAWSGTDTLYALNTVSGVISTVGKCSYPHDDGDITLFNGEFYYSTLVSPYPNFQFGIVKLDVNNPSNSVLITTLPSGIPVWGLSASKYCNTLLSFNGTFAEGGELQMVNLIDGAVIVKCDPAIRTQHLTSMQEYLSPTECDISIDLDCDDSSGAADADYNSEDFDCLSEQVGIADDDVIMLYDAIIQEMTIELTGSLPDDPYEILVMTGSVTGIDVSGSGTSMITLINEGEARSTDFISALQLIKYENTAILPTGGLRTVEVLFTTESGSMSNVGTAFIQVNELPLIELDLGPDLEICEGETVVLVAEAPGANYLWSTGQTTPTITVSAAGEYSVTVSNNSECPNQDTVLLEFIPVIHVSISGDNVICDNQVAMITINTDAVIPLTIEISVSTGSPIILTDILGNYTFQEVPAIGTTYTITNVTPSQSACVDVTNPVHMVMVNSSYYQFFDASICEGDSVWLGYFWETEAGDYENNFNTEAGCDSVVFTTIIVSETITISTNTTTCNMTEVGVFYTLIDNPDGCDTTLETIVSLLAIDTTWIYTTDCNAADTGSITVVLTNIEGCDSIIIADVDYEVHATTHVSMMTCDTNLVGVFHLFLLDQGGCDSLVITTVNLKAGDTSYVFNTSCDPGNIGVFETHLSNQAGCDSLVITTISPGIPDTSHLFTTSCDSASLGVFEEHFISSDGCDSIVITTITYSASDSTIIQSASCNVEDVGVFIESFINGFGCDSIVTTTISLLPKSETTINATTCEPDNAGIFVNNLINQFGCDSIVTTTVSLLPSDETFLSSTTCMSSEVGIFTTAYLNQYGCDSIVTLNVSLVPADTTVFTFKTCDPAQIATLETTYTDQDGCDSLVIEETTLYPLPQLQIEVTSDFNGYAISCFGEIDGSASAEVTGVQPWTYLWSTGSADQSISGLYAGNYSVTVTDANGCQASDQVMLFEPDEFSVSFMVSQPDCFDHQDGAITVEQSGGIEPIRYSIDGINYQSSPVFDQLAGGTYTITALDGNDCEVKEIIWINVPLMVEVELGDDQVILPGDTAIIKALVNVPFDSLADVFWSGLINANCPTCLEQPVAPIITTTYSVTVTSLDGCMDEDAMTLFLENNIDVYVPNIFSPNGDNVNDRLVINTGSSVKEITSMIIFDRWGNIVFAAESFQPGDILQSWDGRFKGQVLNPGVFAYRMIVEFGDGRQEIRYGDVTLVR